jgi:hypothetical protein
MKPSYNSNLYELQWLSQYEDELPLVQSLKLIYRRIRKLNKRRLNCKLTYQLDYEMKYRLNLKGENYEQI